jgi:hypothetical protein
LHKILSLINVRKKDVFCIFLCNHPKEECRQNEKSDSSSFA